MIDCYTLFGFWPKKKVESSLDTLLEIMEKHEVERSLSLSTTGIFYDYEEGNRETLREGRNHPQIVPVATVDLRKYFGGGDGIKRLYEQGFKVLRLFPDLQGWPFHYEPFFHLLEELANTHMPLMVSGFALGGITELVRITDRYEVRVILAGVNYSLHAEALAVMRRREKLYIETSLLDTPDAYEVFVRELGADRMVFGSHAPLHTFSSAFLALQNAEISDEEKQLILKENVERLITCGS